MRKPRSQSRGNQNRSSKADQSRFAKAPPAGASPGSDRRLLWIALGLIAANVVVYATVRRFDFVYFDDQYYVIENTMIAPGLTWRGVAWALTTGYASNWHPLTWLSHMLDVQVYGMHAGGHHLTNLLLHIVNTLLLFGLFHRMTGRLGRSGFVAALFAVHPLHVESVAWVSERKDVLSTLFWMLTLWSYVSYVRQPRPRRYGLVVVLFGLGLLAKPMLVTLPFVLLLLDYWPLGRVTLTGAAGPNLVLTPSSQPRKVWLHLLREKAPLLALAAASSVVTFIVQRRGRSVIGLEVLSIGLRAETALVSYAGYIGHMLWPAHLSTFYPYETSLPVWRVIVAVLILIAASAVALSCARRRPYLIVGWLWYVGTLVPVIGLVQVGHQLMADRYTYIPLIGLFVIVAWGAPDFVAGWRHRRIGLAAAAGLVLAACAMTAQRQVDAWENSVALWQRALDTTTNNFFAHNNLGDALAREGKLDEAIAHYVEALRLRPRWAEAHNSLGVALKRRQKGSEAMAHFAEALRLSPEFPEPRHNLALALAEQGKFAEAIPEMLKAVEKKPEQAAWHYDLALLYRLKGDTDQAVHHLERTLALDPDDKAADRALQQLRPRAPR